MGKIMAEYKLKRGYDIPLAGAAEKILETVAAPEKAALLPQEFRGIKPRLIVKEGDLVKIGTPLFTDKVNPDIRFVSPVSGKVEAVNRGERRMLMEIIVTNDKKDESEKIGDWAEDAVEKMQRDELVGHLLAGGLWPFIIQRPFGIIANPQDIPRDIFISAFDTAPLAAKPGFLLKEKMDDFQRGIDALKKLTEGSVYLSLPKADSLFADIQGVEKNVFSGPHPAGNTGVQIHHIKPLNRGEIVWQIKPEAAALIGAFFRTGIFPTERIVATAGSSLKERKYYKVRAGAPLNALIKQDNIIDENIRLISGNVLTGRTTRCGSFIGFYDTLISVIPEGETKRKLLGYFRPGFKTESFSKTFLSSFIPTKKDYALDTRLKGGVRAFVMSATDYQKVLPMDIMPVQLAKSILAEDIEEMEGLGILELDEEDIALCSYICLSKTDFGKILRDGLNMIQKEG